MGKVISIRGVSKKDSEYGRLLEGDRSTKGLENELDKLVDEIPEYESEEYFKWHDGQNAKNRELTKLKKELLKNWLQKRLEAPPVA